MAAVDDRAQATLDGLQRPVQRVVEAALADVADQLADRVDTAGEITAQGGPGEELPVGETLAALWIAHVDEINDELTAAYTVGVAALLRYLNTELPQQARDRITDQFARQARTRLSAIGDRLADAARAVVARARQAGDTLAQLKARLREEFLGRSTELGESHAETIARTEAGTAWEQGRVEALRALPGGEDDDDAPGWKVWLATLDTRTRPSHHRVDRQSVGVGDTFTVGGAAMDRPLDPAAPPAETVNCRCALVYAWERDSIPGDADRQFLSDQEIADHIQSREERGNPRDIDLAATVASGSLGREPLVPGRAERDTTRPGAPAMAHTDLTAADLAATGQTWSTPGDAALAFEDTETGDGRIFTPGALYWEGDAWPLQYAPELGHGHEGARLAGAILSMGRDGKRITGTGTLYDDTDAGSEALRLLAQGAPLGISVDLDDVSFEIVYKGDEDLDAMVASITTQDATVLTTRGGWRVAFGGCAWHQPDGRHTGTLADVLTAAGVPAEMVASAGDADNDDGTVLIEMESGDEIFRITKGRVRGATLVSIPAFAGARIVLDASDASDVEASAALSAGNTQADVIAYVNAHPNGVTAGDIADALHIETSNARSYLVRGVDNGKLVRLRRGVYGPAEAPAPALAAAGKSPVGFSLVGDLQLPVHADRDREWDGPAAASRVLEWARRDDASDEEVASRLAQAFLWRDDDADPATVSAYALGFADVVESRLEIIARGVFATAGGHGVDQVDGISDEDRDRIKGRICGLYQRLDDALDDIPECPFDDERDDSDDSDDSDMEASASAPPFDDLEASAWNELRKTDPLPAAWFAEPTRDELPPDSGGVHYTDGRIYGWVAQAGVPHQGYTGTKLTIDRLGPIDTSHFLRARIPLDDGSDVKVGAFTMNVGHHRDGHECETAACQFDDTRTVAGVITVGMNRGGMWFSGAASPHLSAWDRTVFAACQPSYHMVKDRGKWSLRAVLSVPVPGHPSKLAASMMVEAVVERSNIALAAAAAQAAVEANEANDVDTAEPETATSPAVPVIDVAALAAAVADELEQRAANRAEAARLAEQLAPVRADIAAGLAAQVHKEG